MKVSTSIRASAGIHALGVAAMWAGGACSGPPAAGEVPAAGRQTQDLAPPPFHDLHDGNFTIHALGNRCIDHGVQPTLNTEVTLKKCHGGSTQVIRVRELDFESNDVALMVPNTGFCLAIGPPPKNAPAVPGPPSKNGSDRLGAWLVTKPCDDSLASQRFAFDGDTLLVGAQKDGERVSREWVIEMEGGNTNHGSHLAVGTRETSDAEYFTMVATDGSSTKPTSGFVQVATAAQLQSAMSFSAWGSVIEVSDSMTLLPTVHVLKMGATLRADRAFAEEAPELHYSYDASTSGEQWAIALEEKTRVTGLRLRGPTADESQGDRISGIMVSGEIDPPLTDVLVDHMDISNWTGGAVDVRGNQFAQDEDPGCAYNGSYPRVPVVHVLRNFIHDNVAGAGYGVVVGWGGFPLVAGNLMHYNRHSITASAQGTNGYIAEENFILEKSYDPNGPDTSNTDFDSHGDSGDGDSHFMCDSDDPSCKAGDVFEMRWNTFCSHEHHNFRQRGTPCSYSKFDFNTSVQSADAALETYSSPSTTLTYVGNHFEADNPTKILGVGDFDGDGVDDVFVGTGSTWWFSPGGRGFWRMLNRLPEHADQVRFGDFDGDGRTDVVAVRKPGTLDVSWAGVSPWQQVTTRPALAQADIAVGDFNGDQVDDVFFADGTSWWYAKGARVWTGYVAQNALKPPALRFGDFTGDGQTDVLFIGPDQPQLVRAAGAAPEPWGPKALTSVVGLVVGDFDGDGADDLARTVGFPGDWEWSPSGSGPLAVRHSAPFTDGYVPLPQSAIGRFDGDASSDVIFLPKLPSSVVRDFWIVPAAHGNRATSSRQNMR